MTDPWLAALRRRCSQMTAKGFLTAPEALALLDIAEAAESLLEVAQEFPHQYQRHVYELLGEPLARAANSQPEPNQ